MTDRRQLLQEALTTIERLEARLEVSEGLRHAPLAIVGAGCRYPGGVEDPEGLWRVVRDGVDAVCEVPKERWDADAYYDPDPKAPGKMVTRRGGFLTQGVDRFDPLFFGISPREAATMDPQQRMLLETSHEALESAGIATDRLAGSATGVFVGITTSDYAQLLRAGGPRNTDVYSATGGALNAAAGRVAFTFGLQGPCVSVDTACSSSLVAVHLACQSLRAGESDLALAGGVNVILSPDAMVLFSKWGMIAPDGACKTFDAAADGFVRAEGCAVLALKRLSDAVAAGDPILAVIRGSAVNSDGRSSGLTVPNGLAQQAVIRKALASARLDPGDIDYVEAHGTGTSLGDPIEVEALGAVMGPGRPVERPLLVGSVKTNLGHCEAASGVAGLLKVVMSLQHGTIPPHLHFSRPNPAIPWAGLGVAVPVVATPWERGERPRRAGVSSFGFSGTNAHIVLEEAPAEPAPAPAPGAPAVVPLSARDDAALRALALRTADFLDGHPGLSLADVARTAGTGRAHLVRRAALVSDGTADLVRDLRELAAGQTPAAAAAGTARAGERPRVAFLFTGQGAQYAGMGRGLYDAEPVFREALDRAAAVLDPLLPRRLLDVVFAAEGQPTPLSETGFTQPALVALELALAELWRSWGVTPSVVLGHSVGEYAAAAAAGVLSFDDALALIAERGRLMQALPAGGGMAAIFEPEARAVARIAPFAGRLSVAAVNGPEETVVSGDGDAVREILAGCERDGVKGRALEVSHAFHSHRLDPMLDALERRAAAVAHAPPRIPLVSNVTGAPFAPGARPDAAYWRRHAREPVRFAACVDALRAAGVAALLEVGPHPTLLALAGRAAPDARWTGAASLRRGRDDRREMLTALAALYACGAPVAWEAVLARRGGRRVALPTYPFQRERHWLAAADAAAAGGSGAVRRGGHPLLGARQPSPAPGAQFLGEVSRGAPAFLADHVVLGATLLPGAAYLEAALAAARAGDARGAIALEGVTIEAPLALDPTEAQLLHLAVEPEVAGRAPFVLRSAPASAAEGPWRVHARGTISRGAAPAGGGAGAVAEVGARCGDEVDVAAYYARLARAGLTYGPAFRGVSALRAGRREAVATLDVTAAAGDDAAPWVLHPALLDAAFHVLGPLLASERAGDLDRVFLPVGLEALRVAVPRAPLRLRASARLRDAAPGATVAIADLRLEGEGGEEIASVSGLQLRPTELATLQRALATLGVSARAFRVRWEKVPAGQPPQGQDGRRLVLLDDAAGTARTLASALAAQGARCRVLAPSEVADLTDEALRALLGEAGPAPLAWVVDCGALDPLDGDEPARGLRPGYLRLLRLSQALAAAAPAAGLCVVTRGAQAVGPGERVAPARAALLGLARTVAAERGDAPALRVDLDPAAPPDVRPLVAALAELHRSEPELAARSGELLAPRLDERLGPAAVEAGRREVLRLRGRGDLDQLQLVREARRGPRAGEVELEIRATGINFRDVLNTLGMVPGAAPELGSECSGTVVAVGPGVEGVAAGDEVVAMAVDSLASHVVAPASLVVRKPAGVSHAAAVTIPNAYLTAALSLLDVAGLRPGQRVLIHAAAGGVGLAALRLARRAGAEVIATAGSPEKRALALREGATHALDSRSASFEDGVREVTGGVGVDCVLNSLTGELAAAGLRVVRPGGVFVEIGKQGLLTQEEAARRAPGIRYVVVDLGEVIQRDPAPVRARLEALLADVAAGTLEALPVRAYPLADAAAAFRTMAAGRHVGKLVLVPGGDAGGPVPVRRDGTYLVTGGLGGLGLATAEWLARRGAGELVLVGRRGPRAEDEPALERLRGLGARVAAVACDVADPEAVRALWRDVLAGRPPLRGVVHAAGVLADAALADQDAARFDAVAASKVAAALNLHAASARDPLDVFVLYSSSSGLFGAPGQAPYAAANAFLDAFAAWRRARGLVATSAAWGAWADVGMAARMPEAQRARWARVGVGLLDPAAAFPLLERALASGAAHVTVAALDPATFAAKAGPAARALMGARAAAPVAAPAADQGPVAALRAAADPAERAVLLRRYLHREAARVLGLDAAVLDDDASLSAFGFDSLMAVQLRNRIEGDLALKLPLAELLAGPTIGQLTEAIGSRLAAGGAPAAAAPAAASSWEEGTL